MRRFDGPLWRVIGSFASWFLFAFCFSLLYRGSSAVMGLGGSCASGGPYQIEVECPAAVAIFVPLSIFGGIAAVAIGLFLAHGFGTPLLAWAWPILFLGLGIAFLVASTVPGAVSFFVCGVLFVLMGGYPLYLELRASARAAFLGTTNAADVPFTTAESPRAAPLRLAYRRDDHPTAVTPTAGDWALSLGILVAALALALVLSALLWQAVT
ncbi:MAG TPA: hypothetical protein VNR36_08630 [Pseudolysinimonas sp.]|nr:hypothetical protein [Pseudolysinimonas sp.]